MNKSDYLILSVLREDSTIRPIRTNRNPSPQVDLLGLKESSLKIHSINRTQIKITQVLKTIKR